MLLDLLNGRFSWLWSQPPRRTLFFLLIQFDDLPLALLGCFSVFKQWAEIFLVSLLAPLF